MVVPFPFPANLGGSQLFLQFCQTRGFPHLTEIDTDIIRGRPPLHMVRGSISSLLQITAGAGIMPPGNEQMRRERSPSL